MGSAPHCDPSTPLAAVPGSRVGTPAESYAVIARRLIRPAAFSENR